jgi:RNA-directed DNA polymerase
MVTFDNLMAAYRTARSNKRRSADSVEFEINAERNLCRLLRDINDRTLRPTAYTFVTMNPRPREIFACDMGLRIVHHYLDIRLRPIIERKLTDRTFNNRIGYGQSAAVNRLASDIYEVSAGFTRDAYIIKADIRGYFPNASQDIVYGQLSRLVIDEYEGDDKEDLLYMLSASVYSYPTHHCRRKSPIAKWRHIPDDKSLFRKPDGVGAAIGHLIWQNAMNYYLNDFDHYVTETLGLHYVRFVDDMVFVVENKEAFLPYMETFRKMLESYGCTMHPRKFYCQHYSKGAEFIGAVIKLDRIYPTTRVVRRALRQVRNLNRCAESGKVMTLVQSLNSYLGIFKTRNGYGWARTVMDAVSPKWRKYCRFDLGRVAIVPREGFSAIDILDKRFHFKKFNHHDKTGTGKRNQCAGVAAA